MFTMAAAQFLTGYFLTLFFCYNQVSLSVASVAWDMKAYDAKQGDHVELTCTVPEVGRFDVVRIEKRRIVNGIVDDAEYKVTDRSSLNSPYKESGIHEVDYNRGADEVAVLKLTFKGESGGIRGEDAGEYTCFSLRHPDDKAKVTVTVEVPVDEVYLFKVSPGPDGEPRRERIESGGQLIMAHGVNEVGVGCHATMRGSLEPISEMKILVDNIDETRLFEEDPAPSTDDQATDDNGFWVYTSQKDLVYKSTKPQEDFNNKELICEAHHGGKSFEKKTATVTLKIEYPPKVSCAKGYKAYTTIGGSLRIVCSVKANPSANITWNHTDELINSPQEEGNIRAIEESLEEDKVRATLNVQKVTEEQITSFTLNAENKLGKHSVTINVIEGSVPVEKPVSLNDNPGHNNPKPGEVKGGNGGPSTVLHSWQLHLLSLTMLLILKINNR